MSRVASDTTLPRAVSTQAVVSAATGAMAFVAAVVVMAFLDVVLLGVTLGVIVLAGATGPPGVGRLMGVDLARGLASSACTRFRRSGVQAEKSPAAGGRRGACRDVAFVGGFGGAGDEAAAER
ncbi:hypothetical protein AB0D34_15365 [Streptomyces sp. NPDC048420]|uniref:hypothetical protein n=1 Tax=Streptomyces sp. NPDC048420 TaxID=3155755 RepID=UPI0034200F45